jgi:membrane peptidoglycan carboxypeptidase
VTLLVLAVVSGVLLAGLTLPFVGGVGLLAKAAGNSLTKLGSCPATPPLPQRSELLAADGSVIATLVGAENRVVVSAAAIPPVMQYSIVAIEDNRFYEHKGVDLRGVLRAASADTSSGGYSQGASTITEQYVKLAEVEQAGQDKTAQAAATEKSLDRKLIDARCAIALEKKLTKQQILTDYLNIAYFNESVYGIGTAAEHYFGVPVQNLTLAQAATLAGIVNDPSAYDPVEHPQASIDRRNAVLDAIAKYDMLPAAQVAAARQTKLVVHPTTSSQDPCASSTAPTFCAYALDQLLTDPKLGATRDERAEKVYEGGLKIYTSYDPTVQHATNVGITEHLSDGIRQVAASVSIQPGTGAILAIGQNRGYGDRAGQTKSVYASQESYEVGSTFKLMTLTAAVEQGIPLTTHIESPACYKVPLDAPGGGSDPGPGGRCPNAFSNADATESCDCDLYSGTWDSVNTFYVQLEEKVGGPRVVGQMATRLGIVGSGPATKDRTFQSGDYGYSLTLGTGGGFSAVDMATAYATIAAHGVTCTPSAVSRITTLTGTPVSFTGSTCHQAVSPSVADTVTSILQGVLTVPGATGSGLGIGRPAAGKTGTTDDGDEGWFVGYTPQIATAVGVFDPLHPDNPVTPITDIHSGITYDENDFFGASIAGPIWQSVMERATDGLPVQDFADPEAYDPAPVAPNPTTSTSTSTSPSTTPSGSPTTSASGGIPTGGATVTVTPTPGLPPVAPPTPATKKRKN